MRFSGVHRDERRARYGGDTREQRVCSPNRSMDHRELLYDPRYELDVDQSVFFLLFLFFLSLYRSCVYGVWIGLLAFRIWQVKRQSRQFLGSNALSPLLRVVIESGAIYSMTVTAALITFVTKSNGVYVVLDIVRSSSHIPHLFFSNIFIIGVGSSPRSYLSSST